jgi:N-acetylneuraminate synthase
MDNEQETVVLQRRAVRAAGPIKVGSVIQRDDLICLRPCPENGLPPYRINEVVGTVAARDIEMGDVVGTADVAAPDGGKRH